MGVGWSVLRGCLALPAAQMLRPGARAAISESERGCFVSAGYVGFGGVNQVQIKAGG